MTDSMAESSVETVTSERVFVLPDLGEGLTDGEVLRWMVKEGDLVSVNQPIVEIETAKAAVEIPSPYAGTVVTCHPAAGDTVEVGAPLITFRVQAAAAAAAAAEPSGTAAAPDEGSGPVLVGYGVTAGSTRRRARVQAPSPHGTVLPEAGPPGEAVKPVRHGGLEVGRAAEARFGTAGSNSEAEVLAKPPVRRLARDLGIDLRTVRATGPDHTITRDDVEAAAALLSPGGLAGGAASLSQGVGEREPIRGVTRAMAAAMTASATTIPHVTEWVEVDVTHSVALLARLKSAPAFEGLRVTPLLLVARAVVAALGRNLRVNAVFDTDAQEIVHRTAINLGIAAATPRGLVVPNIKNAQRLDLADLARALEELTGTAKIGRTSPAQMQGGTFTITNVGVFGIDGGTPIINPGESAILAVGAWREKPWVHGGQVVARTAATLSLSFDHRFIDGAMGSRFLRDVADLLEEPAADLAW